MGRGPLFRFILFSFSLLSSLGNNVTVTLGGTDPTLDHISCSSSLIVPPVTSFRPLSPVLDLHLYLLLFPHSPASHFLQHSQVFSRHFQCGPSTAPKTLLQASLWPKHGLSCHHHSGQGLLRALVC